MRIRKPSLTLGMLALAALLAACGGGESAPAQPTSGPVRADPTEVAAICGSDKMASGPAVRAGDLVITQAGFNNLAIPSFKLPDGLALKPFKLANSDVTHQPALANSPPTNPGMTDHSGGFTLDVCNAYSTKPHTLKSLSVRLDAFTPYKAALNSWNPCNGPYSSQDQTSTGGCGGAYFADEYFHATFAGGAKPGTVASVKQVGSGKSDGASGSGIGPFPLSLDSGQAIEIDVGMTVPTTPGMYTFAFALGVDNAAPVYVTTSTPTLFAPVAHPWSGQGCTRPAMKAQIPTSPPAFYICPEK